MTKVNDERDEENVNFQTDGGDSAARADGGRDVGLVEQHAR